MPGEGKPSEFGGKVGRDGLQPFPHRPTGDEQLRLSYREGTKNTGKRSLSFEGLLGEEETIEKRKSGELPWGWTEPAGLWDEWLKEGEGD